jgi:sporulation integral membrane protein YtvI
MEKVIEKVNKLFLFFIIYSLIFITFFKTLGYTLPFVLAICFALVLKGPTRYLKNRFKLSESLASLITTSVFFFVIIVLLFFVITSLASDITQLTKGISNYVASRSNDFYILFDKLQKYFDNLDPYIVTNIKNSFASSIATITKTTANIGVLVVGSILKFASSVPYILMVIVFTLIATYFFTTDITKSNNKIISSVFSHETDRITEIFSQMKKMLVGYVKSYALIIFITFLVTFIGFLISGVRYALVLSILSAIFDALPILGMAIVYIPVAAVLFINGKIINGIIVLIFFAIVMIVRQIIEPKLISSNLGLHPVSVIAAIFIGLKANGVAGMFFCMFLVVFYTIFKKVDVL